MKNRILTIAATLMLGAATAAFAQAPGGGNPAPGQGMGGGGGGRAAQRMAALMQGITLTPAQRTSVDSINTAFQGRMPAFTPGQRPDSASMASRRQMSQDRDTAIRNVLTSDQQKIWDNNMQTMRANMPQRPN
ncbi:MAG TPA: hypothetical protein VGI92_03255 [Gemmatimonadales bacterium]|jgi:Spy/CpxP family protein refolding chaperone